MLEGFIKDINFVQGSKFEQKGKNLLIRNSDRTALQENLEKYFKSKKIKFERRKKPTELIIDGFNGLLIFKPLKAKGTGGLKFEKQFENDINLWFKGEEVEDLKHGDTITEVVKVLKLKRNSKFYAKGVGSRNSKRPPNFNGTNITLSNNTGLAVSDIDLFATGAAKPFFLSLKFTKQFYIANFSIGALFEDKNKQKSINEYFGFNGLKMKDFGKEYVVKTKKPLYSAVIKNLTQLIKQALGPDVVLVNKVTDGKNLVTQVKGFNHKVRLSGLSDTSYGYPEIGKRKYAFINLMGNINNHNYKITFQFRGTTATDKGPRYCRILFTVL